MSPITFFQEVRSELTKVTWPTPVEVWRSTITVILFSLMVGLFIGALDFIFVNITNFFIGGARG